MDQQQGSQTETPQATPPAAPQQAEPAAIATEPATPSATNVPSGDGPQIISSETTPRKKSKGMFFVIGIALLVIIGGVGFLIATKHSTPQTLTQRANTTTVTAKPSPGVTPVTTANVDQTLNNADSTVQQTVDQANSDLNSVSTIDSSQDNTNGL